MKKTRTYRVPIRLISVDQKYYSMMSVKVTTDDMAGGNIDQVRQTAIDWGRGLIGTIRTTFMGEKFVVADVDSNENYTWSWIDK